MGSIDIRTFHTEELPTLLAAGNGALAALDAEKIGALAIRTPTATYTYRSDGRTIAVLEGDEHARTVVAVSDEMFFGLVADLETPVAMFYRDQVEVVRGNPLRFIRWEPALRAMFHGRPIYDSERMDLRDLEGNPLDPARPFTMHEIGEQRDLAAHYLKTAGYLHVPAVFTDAEIATIRGEADQLEAAAVEGDQESWWGRNTAAETVLCRVLNGARRPLLRALYDDDRIRSIVALVDTDVVHASGDDIDSVTVLWKRPNVKEGLADLPWHRDCGMGGHALTCPCYVMTICLTDGSPAAGELRFLPGSQDTSHPFIDGREDSAPNGVSVVVGAGDVTIHNGDVMHASLPPTSDIGPHRISVLLSYAPPNTTNHRGERHYNDALLSNADGQVDHLETLLTARRPDTGK